MGKHTVERGMFARCNLPAGNQAPMMAANRPMDPRTRTSSPIVTGTSVLGMKYDGGVLMVADMLGSYGSMPRLKECGDSTVVGAGGDLSDFQYIQDLLEELME